MFTHAITRKPGADFNQGLTTVNLGTPDYTRLLDQHAAYIETFRSLGVTVIELDTLPGYPDAYFVEDTAVITPEIAVITRPGAASRQGEEASVESVLSQYRQTVRIEAPGTLDGGDVMMVDRHCFIGLSSRTNTSGAEQLGNILSPFGYRWTSIPVGDGLHLKSSVNYVGKNTLLLTESFSKFDAFQPYQQIVLDADEEYAGNTLWVNDHLITPKGFEKTKAKLQTLKLNLIELDMSEAQKMDGGLTCFSLRMSA